MLVSYPYDWHVPFRPLRDKYALFSCFIIYLSPVNGFIIVFILYFPTWLPLFMQQFVRIFITVIRYCMRDQQSRGHGFPWPQLDHIAISLLLSLSLSCLPPSGGSFGFRLSGLVLSYRLLNQVSSF